MHGEIRKKLAQREKNTSRGWKRVKQRDYYLVTNRPLVSVSGVAEIALQCASGSQLVVIEPLNVTSTH